MWRAIVRSIVAIHWLAIAALLLSVAELLAAGAGASIATRRPLTLLVVVGGGAALSDWILGRCFLTLWENAARRRAGWPTYSASFFEHYAPIVPIRFVNGAIRILRLSAVVGMLGMVWG